MRVYVGLDVSLKRTAICVLDETGRLEWEGWSDTHPEMIGAALSRWGDRLSLVGLETGSTSPWLARELEALGLPVVVMDARRAADAIKARVVKTDRSDARALAEMLRAGWYTRVHVKTEESHRIKALLSSRDQLVRNKRSFFGQIRGMLRPFGIRLAARQGGRAFDEAARAAGRSGHGIRLCRCHDRQGSPSRPRRKRGTQNQAIGKSKGGWTTKILALCDALGNLVRFELLPGNRYDNIGVAPLIEGVEFDALLGDKAFDANWIVEELNQRGAKVVISQRPQRISPIDIDLEMYKWRHLIENFFCKLKEYKRITMRACKTDQSLKALIQLCSAVINSQ